MLKLNGIDELIARVGTDLGTTDWYDVSQARITAFAQGTEDFESIHLDPDRGREAGFGGTIAHGLYTLSLGPKFLYEIFEMTGHSLGLNYGFDTVRFLSPVRVGSRIRMTARLIDTRPIENGYRFTIRQIFQIEGPDKAACVADSVVAYFH
ncbi:MaoC family dehydratase [Rhodococcus jostii]|uniref:Acyl dehydratase n=1 Tax=Rhodococcus jostii TaxID=132919 RepID=A0A1H5A5V5_RHOJO|nr:MaoC family dehydratase [Rhodococcus jostii]SED37846.1 Acyl dehydratase [Rhodococcus jostii]